MKKDPWQTKLLGSVVVLVRFKTENFARVYGIREEEVEDEEMPTFGRFGSTGSPKSS